MEWGLYDLLGPEECRSMRLVCSDMKHAVDALTDILVLRLNRISLTNPATTAEAMGIFHSNRLAATELQVHIAYSPQTDGLAAGRFMAVYATVCRSGLKGVKRCHVHGGGVGSDAEDAQLEPPVIFSLLRALPDLEDLRFMCTEMYKCSDPSTPCVILGALAVTCKRLHTLILSPDMAQGPPTPVSAGANLYSELRELRQLTTLSLCGATACIDLAPLIGLPHFGTLCVANLSGPSSVKLPSVHTLSGCWSYTDDFTQGYGACAWSPSMRSYVDVEALTSFPSLQRLEGLSLFANFTGQMQLLPAAVQRYASSARHWACQLDFTDLRAVHVTAQLPKDSLLAVQHVEVMVGSPQPASIAGCLARLLEAAPHLQSLCFLPVGVVSHSDMLLMLAPLRHAAPRLHTLWMAWVPGEPEAQTEEDAAVAQVHAHASEPADADVHADAHADAPATQSPAAQALAAYLTQPAADDVALDSRSGSGSSGSACCCPSLKRICMVGHMLHEWPEELQLVLP